VLLVLSLLTAIVWAFCGALEDAYILYDCDPVLRWFFNSFLRPGN
jgi:hypothetical protein